MSETAKLWITCALFALTYAALAVGKVPRLRLDRSGIAFIGATLMLCFGVVTLRQAAAPDSIDYETLFLLFGMMVVVGFLRMSGFFERLVHWALDQLDSPRKLLGMIIVLSGVLSAFLVNDIVCLALTPLVLHLAKRLDYDPVPHLVGLATSANIGSTATITGNPQNMFIGAHSHISYFHFASHLMPVAAAGLGLDYGVILLCYGKALRPREDRNKTNSSDRQPASRPAYRRVQVILQWKSGIVALLTIALFFSGLPIAIVAVGAAAFLMIGRMKPKRIYQQVDWSLLVMFVGLFIVVHAFQMRVVSRWGIDHWHFLLARPVDLLSVVSAALSNLVSNVPAVLLFAPVMHAMPAQSQQTAWLALAMSSTLAGNLTVLGSVANLIVVENARREGIEVTFWQYCKAGIPITLLTLGLGIAWLQWVHY